MRSEEIDPLFSKEGGRIDTTLTMQNLPQLVATVGNASQLVYPLSGPLRLLAVAVVCDHGAP